jgi:hypothetical protein
MDALFRSVNIASGGHRHRERSRRAARRERGATPNGLDFRREAI